MDSLMKSLVIVLLLQLSAATELIKKITSNVPVKSVVGGVKDLATDEVTGATGIVNTLTGVDVTTVLDSLKINLPAKVKKDLEHVLDTMGISSANISYVLSLLEVTKNDGLLDFTKLKLKLDDLKNHEPPDFSELSTKYFGRVEEYSVPTEDGYIITVFRIRGLGAPVILSHGILNCAVDFILRGELSLAYILATAGFDIWILNYRGTPYSRKHTSLSPDDPEFWQFSMHEFGYYDLAAVINFVSKDTGRQKVAVVGHSEGTAAPFVLLTTRPEFNDKISIYTAMSPVCYLSDCGPTFTLVVKLGPIINDILLALGIEEIFGPNSIEKKLFIILCTLGMLGYDICLRVGISLVVGENPDNTEPPFFKIAASYFPATTCRKNLNHYLQVGQTDKFAHYDYGSENKDRYGIDIPPLYNLDKVTANVVLFAARNDFILGEKGASRVRDELPNVKGFWIVEQDPKFNHMDFMYGLNAYDCVFAKVLYYLKLYNS